MSEFQFNASATDYDPVNALWLGRAAALAYRASAEIESETAQWGFDSCRFFERGETQAFIATKPDLAIATFRGTEPDEMADLVTDARFRLVPGPAGKVHRGFQEALALVQDDILAEARRICDGYRRLWIAGHSLGGALATLAAAEIFRRDILVQGVYTYGQPRVGDAEFAGWFDAQLKQRTFRHVNFKDYVTIVPFLAMGYRHVGSERYFDGSGHPHGGAPFWMKAWEYGEWAATIWRSRRLDFEIRHGLDCYLINLERQLGQVTP